MYRLKNVEKYQGKKIDEPTSCKIEYNIVQLERILNRSIENQKAKCDFSHSQCVYVKKKDVRPHETAHDILVHIKKNKKYSNILEEQDIIFEKINDYLNNQKYNFVTSKEEKQINVLEPKSKKDDAIICLSYGYEYSITF